MGKTSKGNKKTLFHTIGNILMVLSIVGLFITFFPILKDEFLFRFGNVISAQVVSQNFSIQIPKLKISTPIIKNVDPWNKALYIEKLQQGVAHASGSALPNEKGTMFLFSHSSDYPWRMTRYNTAFYRLGRIEVGDEIVITYEQEPYSYRVVDKKVVWPNEVEYLTNQGKDELILQTCTPIGTDFKRLLVFAKKYQ